MSSSGGWTARVRRADLGVADPISFGAATLLEQYNLPDTFVAVGRLSELRPALAPGLGIVLADEEPGRDPTFAGCLTSFEKRGDGTATATWTSDLGRLGQRIVYPTPGQPWNTGNQAAAWTMTGTSEARLLALIDANAGPGALAERVIDRLRLPASQGRGLVGATSSRFDSLLDLVSALATAANLRIDVRHRYDDAGAPYLAVEIVDPPDLSPTVRFGTPSEGGAYVLSADWSVKVSAPTGTAILSGGPGDGADRQLTEFGPFAYNDQWRGRFETFLDSSGAATSGERVDGYFAAMRAGNAAREVSAPLAADGVDRLDLPVGAIVGAYLDGELITDRIRTVQTDLAGDPTVRAVTRTAAFGTEGADASSDPVSTVFRRYQKNFRLLRKITDRLERSR